MITDMGKRGFRKVPSHIQAAIDALVGDTFQVGTIVRYLSSDLRNGRLEHLGIRYEASQLNIDSPVLPPPQQGRASRWNVEGRVIVRKDLPKIQKDFGWESPNFGDWGKGSHWVSQVRDVYRRESIYGEHLPISIEEGSSADPSQTMLAFRVDRVFDKSTGYQERDLVFVLSLLQENIGSVGIVATSTPLSTWLAEQYVTWEFLPVGRALPSFGDVTRRLRVPPNTPRMRTMQERYDQVAALNPTAIIVGRSGFARYIGFQFRDDLVAFENLDYGNALYLMYENWAELSRRTRVELMLEPEVGYYRIVHRDNWPMTLRNALRARGFNP